MKDAVGNEILVKDVLALKLNSDLVIVQVVEISGGLVVDPATRTVNPEYVRVMMDMKLVPPQEFANAPIQFIPNAYKIHNPKSNVMLEEQKKKEERAQAVDEVMKPKAPTELPPPGGKMFLKRPQDIKDEKLNPSK